jgi:hypothetical protein
VGAEWGRKEEKKWVAHRVESLLHEMRDGMALGRGSGTAAVCEMALESADGEIWTWKKSVLR